MQQPYHIKVSLQTFYEQFEEWPVPDFSDKCVICDAADCAVYHGHYLRSVLCALTGFAVLDFPVMRFLCKGKGDKRKFDHITFSLLPIELVPFRQLPLNFMVLAVCIRLRPHLSLTNALEAIEKELNNFSDVAEFINISTLMSWERLIRSAFSLFLSTDINMSYKSQYQKITDDDRGLLLFLEILKAYKFEKSKVSIRGPDAFAWNFYQQSDKTSPLALFLFGRASQNRNSKC